MSDTSVIDRLEIRQAQRQVLLDGQAVPLRARAYDVLLALAERAERVVSKPELLDVVWGDRIVEENNLTVQISALRRLLGHGCILTVAGRGYRLAGRPRGVAAPAGLAPAVPAPAQAARLQRRLAAIVQADVVDWAHLVADDSHRALSAWRRIRNDLIEPTVPDFGGRAIELTAERVQIEFASVVDAIAWSSELQGQLAAEPDGRPAQPLRMRIGITVDDVIVDDGRLVGDGVILAADLQHSAAAGDILVTERVQALIGNKLQIVFEPLGERMMRRLRLPVQVRRIAPARPADSTAASRPRPAARARMATLAVLPFAADGTDDDSYFGDGITEEIIATLSLNRALFVIAHNSTLRYRPREVDLTEVGSELGVRYLVTGSVRRLGDQIRIRVSLVHAPDQRTLWQAPYDGTTADLFGFQSEIARQVAAAIAPQVQDEEVARVRQRPTERHDAYDCVLRGLAGLYQLGSTEFDRAGDLFQRAITLDPDYAQAHAHLAWWYSLRHAEGRSAPGDDDGRRALSHALLAVRLDGRDAWALSVAAYMLTLLEKQHAQALEMFDRALAINPSCAAAWARSAATLSYLGRADEALERVQRAMHLSPFDQHAFWHLTICGGACFVGGRHAEAAGWLGKALQLNPHFNGARRVRIAALARIGELEEARALAQELLAEFPDFSVREFGRLSPMQPPHLDDLLDGLRQAGLPD